MEKRGVKKASVCALAVKSKKLRSFRLHTCVLWNLSAYSHLTYLFNFGVLRVFIV